MKKRILVVDDEVIIADDLCSSLNKLGYEALEPALTYKQAIDTLSTEPVDLAILDINLGGKKTGMDVAQHIRDHSGIPFIFLSSYSDNKTLELAKNTMPYAYLIKPYGEKDILAAIEIAFNNQRRYMEHKASATPNRIPVFTAMEKVIIRKISENLSTKEIADQLFISESTVKNHRHNICVKLALPAGTHSLLKWVMENSQQLD